ncbi:hypothetical protein Taro_050865 [Colocasia esculenta]|uniref:CCHC-type domain-containing protein n=1 Tax=Colocasia esculenta TaxID=4460 RepID=A0A843XEG8_COLES|nr:hypothetical protein [Colocasia esculenta]
MAAQGYAEGQSVNRPPLFDGEVYNYWKTRMEFVLQGLDFQLWSIIEEGDLVVLNNRENWTGDDKKKISLNCKAKCILCCALSKKEFNRISACKSTMEMWEKLRITYEGTDKVKETRIDILVAQYERFQMQPGESITQMYSKFTDITNVLAGLGKTYDIGDMVRKILRSLPASWTPKVTTIEEANDLRRMSHEKLIGSLMAHEINIERIGESFSRKKHNNALKAAEDTFGDESDGDKSTGSTEDEEAFLFRRLQRILAKKKYQSGKRYFKKGKDFKKSEVKDTKKAEPICYECKKTGHIKAECPKLKKTEFRKKDSSKKFKRYKKKVMAAAWSNDSDSDSESSSSEKEEEKANLAFVANLEEKLTSDSSFNSCNEYDSENLEDAFNELYIKYKDNDKPYRFWHPLCVISKESLCSRQNLLRAFVLLLPTILQNLSIFKSMAVSGVFGTVGGYGVAFIIAEQQEQFAAVMTKLCGNKAVDVVDLEKNGMHSVVAAMQRMKWTRMVTISKERYPDLVKAFFNCLKSEEDGSLTSTVKGTPINITYDLLESLFGVSTNGRSGVDSVDIHVKGLGIIGTEYKLKDGKIDIN